MNMNNYQTIGPDRPLGDREGADEEWSPATVQEISTEEVKNPYDEPDPDIEESDDDPSKD
jgi:hypothetical protein